MVESRCPNTYRAVRDELRRRLLAPPTHVAQLLSGPRQVGKTTLLLELAKEWGDRAVYAAADAPVAALPGWWEQLWARVETAAVHGPQLLLLDEVQYLDGWSRLLKVKIDELARSRRPVHVVATGSAALSVGRGARETMAGRFERLRLLHWPAAEIAHHFGRPPQEAVRELVRFGSFPGAVRLLADEARWRAYVRDSIVEPAVGRDVLSLEAVRRPALLRQVFAVAARHPAEIVSLQKFVGQLREPGAIETVAHYLQLLEEAGMIAALPKYSGEIVRQRSAPPKLVTLNNALLAAAADEPAPSREQQPAVWGRWLENACIALAWNCGQTVFYWRTEPLEVDFVVTGSWGRWAVEVKTGGLEVADAAGALEFCRRYPDFRPAIVCDPGQEAIAAAAGVTAVSWPEFLWGGLPAVG